VTTYGGSPHDMEGWCNIRAGPPAGSGGFALTTVVAKTKPVAGSSHTKAPGGDAGRGGCAGSVLGAATVHTIGGGAWRVGVTSPVLE
jgi:hypothetical protein